LLLRHPDWQFALNVDLEQGLRTCHRRLPWIAQEGLAVIAYHFAFPGIGYLHPEGTGFAYAPVVPTIRKTSKADAPGTFPTFLGSGLWRTKCLTRKNK